MLNASYMHNIKKSLNEHDYQHAFYMLAYSFWELCSQFPPGISWATPVLQTPFCPPVKVWFIPLVDERGVSR